MFTRLRRLTRTIGRWLVCHFRVIALVFAAFMLFACGCIAYFLVDGQAARLRIQDDQSQVDYNRGRIRLQQSEYDQVEALIPEIEARIAELEPKVSEAEAENRAMKDARDTASEGYQNIRKAGEAALAEAREAESELAETQAAYDALLRRLGLTSEEVEE